MSLIRVLQSELRSLSEEARKKYPLIKESADRGIRQLRSIQETVDDDNVNQSKAVRANEEIIKPFLLACESKTTKLIVISLSSLQQLLLHSAVPIGGLNIIVETVTRLSEQNNEESVQLKTLQLALTVFTSDEYELSQTVLAKLLRICFQLHAAKTLNVHYTATATIRQATTVLFDKLGHKTKEVKGSDEAPIVVNNIQESDDEDTKDIFTNAKNLYLLLRDFCLFVEGNPGMWLNVSGVSPAFALELIETTLSSHAPLLLQYSQLVQLIEEKIYPIIANQIYNPAASINDFTFIVRSYRIASSIIQHFYIVMKVQCQDILRKICNLINIECPMLFKILAFELFKSITQNGKVFKLLYEELAENKNASTSVSDQTTEGNILLDLVTAISNSVQKMVRENQTGNIMLQQYLKKDNRMDILLEKGITHISFEECLALAIECIMVTVTSMSVVAGVHKSPDEQEEVSNEESEELKRSREICGCMVENTWCPILAALSQLLERCEEDETIQLILRTYLLFTHTCGVTGLTTPRDAFLTSLCKFTPQVTGTQLVSPITRKNVLVIKILFNFAHCLGGLLGSSWYLLLKNFQMFESIMNRDNFKGELDEDLKILNAALNNLFQSTEHLDSESLIIVLKALCSLSKDTMKNTNPNETPRLFGAMKLVETVQINANRVGLIWSYFSAHILFLVDHSDESVRKFGVESVANVILAIVRPEYNKFTSEPPKPIDSALEQNVFSVLALIFDSNHKDVKERVLHAINNLIQKCGQVLSGSWPIILPILSSCCEEPDENSTKPSLDPKYISIAFKGVQHVANDCLSSLSSDSLLQYIGTVGAYAKQTRAPDVNINLVAVGIFMTVADYLAAEKNQTELWIKLFSQLVNTITDSRPEVRHASLRTLTFCMTSCGDKFDLDSWNALINQVLLATLHKIDEEAGRAEADPSLPPSSESSSEASGRRAVQIMVHHSRNTAAKQWSETRSLAIESVSRVIKEHGGKNLKDVAKFEELCTIFMEFILHSVQTKTAEINKSSVRYIQEMLLACTVPALPIIWKGAWNIWDTLADAAMKNEMVDANTMTFLVEGLMELYNTRREIFSQDDVQHLIQLVHSFLRCSTAMDVIMHPSTIQRACLQLLTTICSYSEDTYDYVFDELASILPSKTDIETQLQTQERERFAKLSNLPPAKSLQPPVKLAVAVQKDLVDMMLNAPESVQKRLYHRLVNVLGTMMLTKYVVFTRADPTSKSMRGNPPFFYPLWKSTIKLFESVISNSSKHFAKESNSDTVNNMWLDFCQAVETFLFPSSMSEEFENMSSRSEEADDDSDDSDSDEELGRENEEIQLLHLIEKYALPHCQCASGHVKQRILAVLERATHTSPKLIATESLKCIFRLIKEATDACERRDGGNIEINDDHLIEVGQYVIPIILDRCADILKSFLKEDQRTGQMPLPRYRREEVLNVLQELRSVQVHSLLFDKCPPLSPKQSSGSSPIVALSGPKGMIIRLFPILCEFVVTPDNSIKAVLLDMFRIVSAELGLSEQTTSPTQE